MLSLKLQWKTISWCEKLSRSKIKIKAKCQIWNHFKIITFLSLDQQKSYLYIFSWLISICLFIYIYIYIYIQKHTHIFLFSLFIYNPVSLHLLHMCHINLSQFVLISLSISQAMCISVLSQQNLNNFWPFLTRGIGTPYIYQNMCHIPMPWCIVYRVQYFHPQGMQMSMLCP